ncbi:caspase, EACC1-associated type [Streptomyces sp. NBC_00648]|uniref:caspase, EACC1-associated type n=1 Tax=Streptomyces sp. NBC_00648 TaxID=2975797 RepID=UPI00324E6FF9
MTARLSDPAASRAVLIGIPTYAAGGQLAQLPAVERNITALRDALCDDAVWGLAPASCRVLGSEADGGDVMRAIDAAVREAEDTLLVYYAGHGLLHPDRPTDLHLALHDSNEQQMWRALPYTHIRDEVRSAHRRHGLKCAMILDCCFSGAAVEGGMSTRESLLKQAADIDGVCVLTSSAATEVAYSLADEQLSAFTGALLGLLRTGAPEAGPVLDFGTVHARLHQTLSSREHPQHPQIGAHNSGERIAVFRNPAHTAPTTPEADRGADAAGPLPATRLFGRERELRELTAEAARGPGVLVIHGPPGVGKSALAAALRQRLTPSTQKPPATHPPLVLLDDVTDAAELNRADVTPRDALILVTSRASLTDAMPPQHIRRYALAPLEVSDAVALMQDISGLTGHEAELTEIAELLSCFPLALRPIAARLRRTPPDLLLDAMRESDRPLQHLHSDDDRVRTAFTVSYEALSDQQKQVLRDCAGHPGPDFDRRSAAALCRLPPGICGLMLEELVDVGLLQRANGRYAFHDLYRSYSRTTPAGEVLRRTSLYLHLRGRLGPAGEDSARTAWRAAALGELRAAARAAREDRWNLATELGCDVADALHEEERPEEAKEEAEAAYRYATDHGHGAGIARARAALARLGAEPAPGRVPPTVSAPSASRQEVAAELRRAAEASPEAGTEHGRHLMALAERALAADLVEEALTFQAEARSWVEETGDDNGLLAECLVAEAALRIHAGQYPDAVELAQRAARLLDERGDREGAAHSHATAAEALRKAGTLETARRHARLALAHFEAVGTPANLSYAYRLIAKIEWALGNHAHARRLMHQAHELRHGLDAEEGPSTKAIAHPSSRAVRMGHHLGNREIPRSTDGGLSG